MKKNLAADVLAQIHAPGDEGGQGATVNLNPGLPAATMLVLDEHQPETYVVGMGEIVAEIAVDEITEDAIAYAISTARSKSINVWSGLGFWVDPDSKTVVIERVETYTHPGVALEQARLRGEKAIYALKSKREIFL